MVKRKEMKHKGNEQKDLKESNGNKKKIRKWKRKSDGIWKDNWEDEIYKERKNDE